MRKILDGNFLFLILFLKTHAFKYNWKNIYIKEAHIKFIGCSGLSEGLQEEDFLADNQCTNYVVDFIVFGISILDDSSALY